MFDVTAITLHSVSSSFHVRTFPVFSFFLPPPPPSRFCFSLRTAITMHRPKNPIRQSLYSTYWNSWPSALSRNRFRARRLRHQMIVPMSFANSIPIQFNYFVVHFYRFNTSIPLAGFSSLSLSDCNQTSSFSTETDGDEGKR